mmetsp:Transcript_47330/g.75855  ORF Transcript_47330/g.75855 Transcript_47330/m.75855 type:complete len:411 (+) Transcript_47330:67-1299(+)|eukprot:CAMPEP_0197076160 /NCGR_PEP_ID=MMETSP1384-20130603/211971_1 /TAXON_ID=29189 /ORGANISM="Ammonia sp." /LENGTH=410 /DNA_ID=CAMNT_0042515009 /DNA_START=57 /DNA_END=1289 /DNA_ORIENTATION=+
MAASFPPMMFSMEELVGVVKLIIQMESAVAQDDDQKNHPHLDNNNNNNGHLHNNGHHKKKHHDPPNIQRWISRRSKRDILFLLASISGVKMQIFSLPISTKLNNGNTSSSTAGHGKSGKVNVCKERVCRVSMDGKYLSMGEDCINLDKRLEVSLGIDVCYYNVRLILRQMGIYHQYTSSLMSSTYDSTTSNSGSPYSSGSSSTIHDDLISKARFNHKFGSGDKLKAKHCITIHDPATNRTLILQLNNCSDRTMWAKGLCHLKHLNPKARNFRWTVVAYLISKYASTLNAHSQHNLNHNAKGLKGVTKGLNALKMGLSAASKSKPKPIAAHNPMNTPCYFEPFVALIRVIGQQNANGLHSKYPPRYKEMYKRRQNRLRQHRSNYENFGENDLVYDPNKAVADPQDNDIYYE